MTKAKKNYMAFGLFLAFLGMSMVTDFDLGLRIADNFWLFAWDMLRILPPAFILIGLFDVWASREMIEKNFGQISGPRKYIWGILLAATTVGGTFVAFPVANALYHKGADYSAIFTYVTSASLVMIPMSIMEATILGPRFTLIRLGISLPLVVISSAALGSYFDRRRYQLPEQA
jgi:uncharacterized membrane protein YraQ (UPF0718 family)